jgi:NDP-sugar pyrophosphorylase family protein
MHHLANTLKAGVSKLDVTGLEIAWSDETAQILGSGGGIAHAISQLGERFFVLNADTVCPLNLKALAEKHLSLRNEGVKATLALKRRAPDSLYAGVEVRGDKISKFRSTAGTTFYVGAGVFERSLFKSAPRGEFDLVEQILGPAASRGAVAFLETDEVFLDIGSPDQWASAHFEVMRAPKKFPRIQKICQKLPNDVWALKGAQPPTDAEGPAFWGVTKKLSGGFGPRAIVYDEASAPPWKQGLWYGGHSVSLGQQVQKTGQSPRRGKP